MAQNISLKIDTRTAQLGLRQLAERASDTTGLMRRIAGHLQDVADEASATETDPDGKRWESLSPLTIAIRKRKGKWPGFKLQVQGILAASINATHGNGYAQIGSNLPYARIQHKGGRAGRGHRANIPARPFLGVSAEAEQEIMDDVALWFSLAPRHIRLARE